MKYIATVEYGRFRPGDRYAVVTTSGATTNERLALRHARAITAMVRANKAWRRAIDRALRTGAARDWQLASTAQLCVVGATRLLERVEKEFGR